VGHVVVDSVIVSPFLRSLFSGNDGRETVVSLVGIALAEGVLFLPDELKNALVDRSPSSRRFMTSLATDRVLSSLLREARKIYRHDCLIHGDIRADNWILEKDHERHRIKLLDWEMSGSGDPVWDIASALAECALQGIRESVDWEPRDDGWPKIVDAMAPNFLRAYLATGGAAIDGRRTVLFAAARLLHIASEWVDSQADFDGNAGIAPILQIVRSLWNKSDRAAARLAQWTA
jgi:Phosphotransferase enzyme family